MATTTKNEIVERIADETKSSKKLVSTVVQSFLNEIINELGNGNRMEFRDFGVFDIKERPSRIAQNPKTLEKVQVPAKRKVKFKAGKVMRKVINNTDGDQ